MNKPQVNHFKRATAMLAAIQVILTSVPQMLQGSAIAALGEYKSRGHGKGKLGRDYIKNGSKYKPHQGKLEANRRVSQMTYKVDRGINLYGESVLMTSRYLFGVKCPSHLNVRLKGSRA